MKIGIYLSGLGETYTKESVEKYARRFARQYDFANPDEVPSYEVHVDKFEYDKQHQLVCNRVVISEVKDGAAQAVYKFYEYPYAAILTRNFKAKNALIKSLLLFIGVCSKLPLMIYRLFYAGKNVGYQPRFRGQTLYLFLLFFIVSLGVLFLLPAAVAVLLNLLKQDTWLNTWVTARGWDFLVFENFLKLITNITALLILLMPGFNDTIVSLACEFVSASNYLERGDMKQTIHGQMDILIEQILKEEGKEAELYFHSYSFGTLVCLDYIFPYGLKPSVRLQQHLKGLITIGSPIDFIKVYFPKFFSGRNMQLNDQMEWINVYSLADALASNFRTKGDEGAAEYSFDMNARKPFNVRYEVANTDVNIVTQFFTLYALKAHGSYWEKEDDGQSCFRELIPAMKEHGFL